MSIATGTYFEQGGGLRNKRVGGGGSRDKSDARHFDAKEQFLLIIFIISINISEFFFIVAVFINTKIKKNY